METSGLIYISFSSLIDIGVYSSIFQVFGVGVPNPYRLRPFLGARVPLNFSFSTLINMHNPYSSPLQVSGPLFNITALLLL